VWCSGRRVRRNHSQNQTQSASRQPATGRASRFPWTKACRGRVKVCVRRHYQGRADLQGQATGQLGPERLPHCHFRSRRQQGEIKGNLWITINYQIEGVGTSSSWWRPTRGRRRKPCLGETRTSGRGESRHERLKHLDRQDVVLPLGRPTHQDNRRRILTIPRRHRRR